MYSPRMASPGGVTSGTVAERTEPKAADADGGLVPAEKTMLATKKKQPAAITDCFPVRTTHHLFIQISSYQRSWHMDQPNDWLSANYRVAPE